MASPLDLYKGMPSWQQSTLFGVIFLVMAAVFYYLCLGKLGELGADNDSMIPSFLLAESGSETLIGQQKDAQNKIQQAKVKSAKLPKVEQELAALEVDIKEAEQRLPNTAETTRIRETLQRMAREVPEKFGLVDIKAVKISRQSSTPTNSRKSKAKKKDDFSTVKYSCQLTADLDGLIAYINAIERNKRPFMAVDKISIAPGNVRYDQLEDDIEHTPHSINLDVLTFVYTGGE